ncbi:hypothetical protein WN55_10829 [Dufourea novaeangliae]|uniref:Uncharacterized protein n=1 Tax=Dufourea novaeangliae TaxID=178035 RepID=A0A154P9K0_DUFNO|nr:hypothetical protein WN55_10829 [Dufourea novaeangliae]
MRDRITIPDPPEIFPPIWSSLADYSESKRRSGSTRRKKVDAQRRGTGKKRKARQDEPCEKEQKTNTTKKVGSGGRGV